MNTPLLRPYELVVRADTLIFCVENQATCYWAIERKALEESNPPVVIADAEPEWEAWEVRSPLIWRPSHAHLSDFLDDLTYQHAFCGGAIHGGWTELSIPRSSSMHGWSSTGTARPLAQCASGWRWMRPIMISHFTCAMDRRSPCFTDAVSPVGRARHSMRSVKHFR